MREVSTVFTACGETRPVPRPGNSPGARSLTRSESAARRAGGDSPFRRPLRNAVPGLLLPLLLALVAGTGNGQETAVPADASSGAPRAVSPASPAGSGEANPDEPLRLDLEEARATVRLLADRNEKLLKEKLELQAQVVTLSRSLALLQAEIDRQAAQRDSDGMGPPLPVGMEDGRTLADARVVDVNENLRMIILDVGRLNGIRLGAALSVARGESPVARVRVLDVRDAVSGAVIEENFTGAPPQKGDRLVFWKEKESP